jgi:hypothetical protein
MDRTGDGEQNGLGIAAVASAAAGVMHAAAAGIHAGHPELARVFVALTIAQIGVAVIGFVRPTRWAAAAIAAVNAIALAGWIVTRLYGISWIDGLQTAERPQPADLLAGFFAAVALVVALMAVAGRLPAISTVSVTLTWVGAAVLLVPGLVNATNRDHQIDDHVDASAPSDYHLFGTGAGLTSGAAGAAAALGSGESETPPPTVHPPAVSTDTLPDDMSDMAGMSDMSDMPGMEPTVDPPHPYDPTLPIDLSGVAGVTPQQQAFAENLVAETVRELSLVDAAGFHSIGDAATGHEHYIQWDWINDDVWLDPNHPESLVFEPQPDGSKKLVSAMFMLPSTVSLEDVPDWGGALMQWHVHGDLCFTDDPVAPQVAGIKPLGGTCRPPLVDFPQSPMIHVWITPTPCGPFAALEGIGGGQVPKGQAVLCDHAHGSP